MPRKNINITVTVPISITIAGTFLGYVLSNYDEVERYLIIYLHYEWSAWLLISSGILILFLVPYKILLKTKLKQESPEDKEMEINFQTCGWLPALCVWKHKTSDVLFCQKCHSPLSSDMTAIPNNTCDEGSALTEILIPNHYIAWVMPGRSRNGLGFVRPAQP